MFFLRALDINIASFTSDTCLISPIIIEKTMIMCVSRKSTYGFRSRRLNNFKTGKILVLPMQLRKYLTV